MDVFHPHRERNPIGRWKSEDMNLVLTVYSSEVNFRGNWRREREEKEKKEKGEEEDKGKGKGEKKRKKRKEMKRRKGRKIKEGKRKEKERRVEERGSYEKKFKYNILLIQITMKGSYDRAYNALSHSLRSRNPEATTYPQAHSFGSRRQVALGAMDPHLPTRFIQSQSNDDWGEGRHSDSDPRNNKIKKNNSISIKAYPRRSSRSRRQTCTPPLDLSNRRPMLPDGRGVVPDPRKSEEEEIKDRLKKNWRRQGEEGELKTNRRSQVEERELKKKNSHRREIEEEQNEEEMKRMS